MEAPAKLTREWRAKLRASGFRDVEHGDRRLRVADTIPAGEEHTAAVTMWKDWAASVLKMHRFARPMDRRIWGLYAQGTTLTLIVAATKRPRRAITRAIKRVELEVPPAPCENPWRKSGRSTPKPNWTESLPYRARKSVVARLLTHTLAICDRSRLMLAVAKDPELARLLPQEATNMGGSNGTATASQEKVRDTAPMVGPRGLVNYKRITLRGGLTVQVWLTTGARQEKSELVNVQGRPHAGGIDVIFDGKRDSIAIRQTITVPWATIRQADQVEPIEVDE